MQSRFKDWGDVRVFLAVCRAGSTLAAARKLGVNQTTVARRLDVLEHALGLTLFTKTTRGAQPTEAALRLIPIAETLEEAVFALESEAREIGDALSGAPIRITAFDSAMMGNVGQVVAEYVESHPGAAFEFLAAERHLDLAAGEADVALRMSPAISDDRLIARKVGETCWTYYAARSYARKYGMPDHMAPDMTPHRVILLSHITSKRRNVLRCQTAGELQLALQAGQGIGPMPVCDGDRDPLLIRCFDPPPGSELSVWLVVSPEAHKRPEVRRFTAFAAPRIARNLNLTGDAD